MINGGIGIIASSQTSSFGYEVGGGVTQTHGDGSPHRSIGTITTLNPHGVKVNQRITVTGTGAPFDGTWTVISVTTDTISFWLDQHSNTTTAVSGHVLVSSGAPKKTPDQFEGLVAWYSGSSAVTLETSSGRVTKWWDTSGNNNHITAPSGSNQRPTITTFDGHMGINFQGGGGNGRYLYGNLPQLAGLTDFSIFVVGAAVGNAQHSGIDQVAVSVQNLRELGMNFDVGSSLNVATYNAGGNINNFINGGYIDSRVALIEGSTNLAGKSCLSICTDFTGNTSGLSDPYMPFTAMPIISPSFPNGPDLTVGRDKVPPSGTPRRWRGDIYEMVIYAGNIAGTPLIYNQLLDYFKGKYSLGLPL